MADQPLVSVIILNWNGLDDTLECLQSLRQSTHRRLRLIVWDNGSREDPSAALSAFPEITLLRSESNLGFAAGCNRAAEYALAEGTDYLLFLNNDTVVPSEMIGAMLRASQMIEAMVQAHQANGQSGLIGVPEQLYGQPEAPRRLGATWLPLSCRVRWVYGKGDEPEVLPLDVISGCAMLMPADLARQVGLFDELFFAYWEDVDLSLRVKQAGFENVCATSTSVIHKSGRSTGRQPGFNATQLYLVCRGQALIARKHARGLGRVTSALRIGLSGLVARFL